MPLYGAPGYIQNLRDLPVFHVEEIGYVPSDVHGFYSLMHSRLEDAGYFTNPETHKLLILGDLFDRGKEAREMQRFLLDEMKEDRGILIRGNHEDLFQELIYEDGGYPRSHHRHKYGMSGDFNSEAFAHDARQEVTILPAGREARDHYGHRASVRS